MFYQLKAPDSSLAAVLSACSAFQKEIALATCSTLTPYLAVLASSGINSFSLRISTQADMVRLMSVFLIELSWFDCCGVAQSAD